MLNPLLRRRRMLAGMVALGFMGPSALAQVKQAPMCMTVLKSDNPNIKSASGRINDKGPMTSATISPSHIAANKDLGITGVGAWLWMYETDAGQRMSFTISRLEPPSTDFYGARVIFSFMRRDFPEDFETVYSTTSTGFQIPEGVRLFGRVSGRLLIRVLYAGSSDPINPDLTFQYQPEVLNEAWALAEEAMRETKKMADAKACFKEPPPLPYCFLTTAAVDAIGLADDCWELETLRKYRDTWLSHQPGGRELIEEYYEHAPGIAQCLSREPRKLARLYFTCILPSAVFAKLGLNRAARSLYSHHMRKLMKVGANLVAA